MPAANEWVQATAAASLVFCALGDSLLTGSLGAQFTAAVPDPRRSATKV